MAEEFDRDALMSEIRAELEARLAESMGELSGRIEEETGRRIGESIAQWQQNAALTDEEKLSQREKAIAARETELMRRELNAVAAGELARRGLPAEMAAGMRFEDRAECETACAALEEAFRSAVRGEVEARLTGRQPVMGRPSVDPMELTDEQYYGLINEAMI